MGINTAYNWNPRNIVTKTSAYTALVTDDLINVTGTTTITLPSISSLAASGFGAKAFKIANTGTAVVTVAQASGNTIGGLTANKTVLPGESIVINSSLPSDWKIVDPEEQITGKSLAEAFGQQIQVATVGTATTANNIFSSGSTAPVALNVVGVVVISHDTFANSITVQNGTATVTTITKSTSVGVPVGGIVANGAVSAASTFTVTGNATGTCSVMVVYKGL